MLAGWLYLRGYNVSLPFFAHHDEAHHLLAAQHTIDFGHARGVFHDAYPPGTKTLAYLTLKHIKPIEAHHGAMLPMLRLITITAWMLVIVLVALLGAMIIHPLAGLMAAGIWIVNPWVVERAHWLLPDGYLTLFTLLALWLALVSLLQGRRRFSTAAVYSIMLAIVFKTQALFVAPIIALMPLLNWRRQPAGRKDAWQQTFWNCARFAVFLFWLLLIYPTLEADNTIYFPMSYESMMFPSLESAWVSLQNVWRPFPWSERWLYVAIASALLWRYRQRVNAIALLTIVLAGAAWLLGMSMFNVQRARHYFPVGAMLALLYGCGLTGLLFIGQEALSRFKPPFLPTRLHDFLVPAALLILLAIRLLPSYRQSDALAHNFSLHDRRNDLMHYMDTSLEPGKYITDRDAPSTISESWGKYLTTIERGNHKTFNRAWGGYDGIHDFPVAQDVYDLLNKPLDIWRANDAQYAILPYPPNTNDPDVYFPDETVVLKSYPPDANFRGPSMVVLRLYPMQYETDAQLGSIRLVGYDLNASQLLAGEDIVLRHYWRAESPTDSQRHVYNHLLDRQGEIVAQADYVPLWDDRRPTSTWDDPDEILLGREFVLSTPDDLPPATYQLVSGLYNPDTWQRLLSPDGSDHIEIAEITISEPEA
ncbi:MAG: hypothetical protein OXG78_03995 [Chloroflexi bacterium]|nr:hypothetical protein [Chloroflexota bacterium]